MNFIFIGIGGALGALFRYLVGISMGSLFPTNFPIGTLVANLIGCFIIGIAFQIFYHEIIHIKLNPFIITGFLGAFTTFSSYAYTTLVLFENGNSGFAILNFLLNNIFGILFAFLGSKITNFIVTKHFKNRYKEEK